MMIGCCCGFLKAVFCAASWPLLALGSTECTGKIPAQTRASGRSQGGVVCFEAAVLAAMVADSAAASDAMSSIGAFLLFGRADIMMCGCGLGSCSTCVHHSFVHQSRGNWLCLSLLCTLLQPMYSKWSQAMHGKGIEGNACWRLLVQQAAASQMLVLLSSVDNWHRSAACICLVPLVGGLGS